MRILRPYKILIVFLTLSIFLLSTNYLFAENVGVSAVVSASIGRVHTGTGNVRNTTNIGRPDRWIAAWNARRIAAQIDARWAVGERRPGRVHRPGDDAGNRSCAVAAGIRGGPCSGLRTAATAGRDGTVRSTRSDRGTGVGSRC